MRATGFKSLTAQIKDAERQVSNRQCQVGIRAATLGQQIHQQITAPSTLLLACGAGFIIGELTRKPPKCTGTAGQPRMTETSPLQTALNLFASARTLYLALPITWMVKTLRQRSRPGAGPVHEQQL